MRVKTGNLGILTYFIEFLDRRRVLYRSRACQAATAADWLEMVIIVNR
jgi:hypothetical protein